MLLDVTLRDGGYVNGHAWTVAEAESIVSAVDAAGISHVEVGYVASGAADPLRPSASCPTWYLRRLTGRDAQLVVMVRTEQAAPDDLKRLADDGVAMVRVVAPGGRVKAVRPYVAAAREAGLAVTVNLTRVSESSPRALAQAARDAADAGAEIVYLADSNGSLFPDDVRARIAATRDATPVAIGFHAHDNVGLAFANTCAAIQEGATALDGSMAGIGKGGGNLKLELIVAHWIVERGAPLRLDPLVGNRAVLATQLKMVAEGHYGSLVAGLLDVNLDTARTTAEFVAAFGFDELLRTSTADKRAAPYPNGQPEPALAVVSQPSRPQPNERTT